MQARKLKALLNNTGYSLTNHNGYIAVGSSMVHDIIKVDKKTLDREYALGNHDRSSIKHKELEFIWDALGELAEIGKLREIIDNDDVLDNPLPVFTEQDGQIVETTTDAYGWPNVTVSGELMHDNTYFKTREEAITYAISEYEAGVRMWARRRDEVVVSLAKVDAAIEEERKKLEYLKSLQKTP